MTISMNNLNVSLYHLFTHTLLQSSLLKGVANRKFR